MPRKSFIWCPVEKRLVPKVREQEGAAAPFVISDAMDATWHPANGKKYESKSTFRRVTKAHGCEEVGNERQVSRRSFDQVTRDDIKRAIHKVREGYRPRVPNETLD